MWVVTEKLRVNGSSKIVTIPRPFLARLGWLSGRMLVLEMDEDLKRVVVREPQLSDFGPVIPPREILDQNPRIR